MARTVKDAERKHANELTRQARVAAQLRADNVRLRDAATTFATAVPSVPPTDSDPCAAYRERAATLGALLGDVDAAAGELAEAADRHAAEVRMLLDSWPR